MVYLRVGWIGFVMWTLGMNTGGDQEEFSSNKGCYTVGIYTLRESPGITGRCMQHQDYAGGSKGLMIHYSLRPS